MPGFITIPPNVTSYRLTNARVPVCLVADAAQLAPDADGLAPCDIVIDNARIAAIGPAVQDGLPRVDLDNGIVLPRFVDVHTHIDKGHIWHRAQNPDGTHLGARDHRHGRPFGQLVARGRRQAHGLRAALRLRARHRRAAHAYRHLSDTDGDLLGRVRRDARGVEGPRHLAAGRAVSDRSRDSPTRRNSASRWKPWRSMAACSAA